MTEPQIRQRNPFKFASEIPEIDQDVPDRILDEQEQEHIIEQLQKENTRLEGRYIRLGVAVLSISMLLQILSFLGITTTADFVSRAFNILYLLLHLHALQTLHGKDEISLSDNVIHLPAFLPTQLLVLVQPILVLLQTPEVDWIQLSPPSLATLVTWVCLTAIEEGRRGVEALDGLKYEAKGA